MEFIYLNAYISSWLSMQKNSWFHIQISMRDLNDMTPVFQLSHPIQFLDSGMEKMQLSQEYLNHYYETKFTFSEECVKDVPEFPHFPALYLTNFRK